VKQAMADLNPKPEEVAAKVPELRQAFDSKYADNIENGLYNAADLARLRTDDAFARCFLRSMKSRGVVDKAVDLVHDSLSFRVEIGLAELNESSFPAEITDRKAIYYKGTDVSGHPILYINLKESGTKSDQTHSAKQFIAWNFDQHYKVNPEQMCVLLMDMSGAGMAQLNMELTKFIIQCFTTNFPAFLAYMINYEMPTLLSVGWAAVSAFLSAEQKKKLLSVRKHDITKYIAPEHLWPHMKD